MKYKIAICDDSDADRQYVLNMVERWAVSAGHVVHTDTFTSAENFLFHYAKESDYDILLLDIEMGAMDGVTMAKQLRRNQRHRSDRFHHGLLRLHFRGLRSGSSPLSDEAGQGRKALLGARPCHRETFQE